MIKQSEKTRAFIDEIEAVCKKHGRVFRRVSCCCHDDSIVEYDQAVIDDMRTAEDGLLIDEIKADCTLVNAVTGEALTGTIGHDLAHRLTYRESVLAHRVSGTWHAGGGSLLDKAIRVRAVPKEPKPWTS